MYGDEVGVAINLDVKKDTEIVFALYKVGVQLDVTFVTCGGIHVLLNIINEKCKRTNTQQFHEVFREKAHCNHHRGLVEVT